METAMAINYWAVLAAAVLAFAIGAVWYGPIFGKRWQALTGLSDDDIASGNMAMTYGVAFLLTLVISYGLAMAVGHTSMGSAGGLMGGLMTGLKVSILFVATTMGINYLFSIKPLGLWLIDAGYVVVMFAAIGTVLGAWPG